MMKSKKAQKVAMVQQEIFEKLSKYVDENNCIDLTTFRKKYPSIYSRIPYYYGSIGDMLKQYGWVRLIKNDVTKNDIPLKDKLAFLALKNLQKSHSFEEIGKACNVSRACVWNLLNALEKNMSDTNKALLANLKLE